MFAIISSLCYTFKYARNIVEFQEHLASITIINMQGTIKTLTEKGFGFIAREGESKDLFFHNSELVGVTFDELQVGDAVTFEVTDGPKGPAATKVSRA